VSTDIWNLQSATAYTAVIVQFISVSIGSQKIPPYGFLSLCLLLRYLSRVALAFSKFQAVGKLQNLN